MASDIIITQRLVLRSARASDLRPLQDLVFSAPEVMRLAFEGKSLSAEESAEFFAESFDHDGNGKQIGVLRLRAEETIIGFAGLLCCEVLGKRDYETGFVLGREFWGNGYATEIGRAQIEYGFENAGCERLLALAAPDNKPSIAVLTKIGMWHHSTIVTGSRGKRSVYMARRHS